MLRFVDKQLYEWANQKEAKPLLVRGARQVGKTYAVRQLGKTFEHFVEINLELTARARDIFVPDLRPERIIEEIQYLTKEKIVPGKTLLFLDEIQVEPRVVQALRYFYEMMPELRVIAAGSLIDFAIEAVGIPVGRVEFLYMYPLSFLEFLHARGEQMLLDAIKNHTDVAKPLSVIAHEQLLVLVKEFLAIGGMPEVVHAWVQHRDVQRCAKIQQSLVDSYRQDFSKYAKRHQIKYLDTLFNAIPLHLGAKFKYSVIHGEYKKRELAPCLDLLVTAGVVHKVYSTAAQGLPLGAQIDHDDFKLIFLDIALAQVVLGFDLSEWLLSGDASWINKGSIVEAFVGQELLAYSRSTSKQQLYYWRREGRTAQAEIDYVVALKQNIVPIEVKGGPGSTLKSMHLFLQSHSLSVYGVRFSTQNYSVHGAIHSYPLYAVCEAMKNNLTL